MNEKQKLYDAIIVGAGLGGLSAGARLAKAGYKILLLEQHRVVGGCATAFKRKDTIFEVGLHETGSVANPETIERFKKMGIYDKVEFVRVPEFYRIRKGDLDVVVPDSVEEARVALLNSFPNDKKAVNQYFDDLLTITAQGKLLLQPIKKLLATAPFIIYKVRKLLKYRKWTVGQYMDHLTDNEDLKFALIANLGYYDHDPYTLSFLFFVFAQSSYLQGGGWFIKGGSQKLSDAFAEVIQEHEGEIKLKSLVTEILIENNTAKGVSYTYKGEKYKAYGRTIIANAPLPTVVNSLIPALKHSKAQQQLSKLTIPNSLITIYLSFTESISEYFDHRYSTFYYEDDVNDLHEFGQLESSDDYERKGFVFVDYDAIDSELGHTASICGIDYLKNWKDLNEEEYQQKKEEVMNIFIRRLNERHPSIATKIKFKEISTPKTIVHYTLNPHGTVYGYAQTPLQAFRSKDRYIKIGNLYFASAWVMAGGFGGAIGNGYLCASKVMHALK